MFQRRIGGAGGGSDKGRAGGGAVVAVGLGITLAVGAGGTSVVGEAAGAGASSVSVSSGSSAVPRGRARIGTQRSQAAQVRLTRQGVRVRSRLTDDAVDCAGHAYGQLRDFFRSHPCVGLHRALFDIRDRRGDVILLAVAWVEMPDEAGARALHRLVDADGTGNITELSRERGRYRSVRFTGDLYASHRDGTMVTNAQLQPVARGGAGLAFTSILTTAVR